MAKKGGGDAASREAAQARADEANRQARIRAGTGEIDSIFAKSFTPEFFKERETAFQDYATPQVDDQFGEAKKQLTFSLARNGTLDSTMRAEKEGELTKLNDTNRRTIADQSLAYGNEARNSVEGARADLVKTLNTSGDAEGAASGALSRATSLSAPQAFSPIGQLFAGFTGALGQQAQLERAAALSGGLVKPAFNTGLFANSGSVKVS